MDRVCHFEIPFSDKSRATAFYQEVFGWQCLRYARRYALHLRGHDAGGRTAGIQRRPGGINGGMVPPW